MLNTQFIQDEFCWKSFHDLSYWLILSLITYISHKSTLVRQSLREWEGDRASGGSLILVILTCCNLSISIGRPTRNSDPICYLLALTLVGLGSTSSNMFLLKSLDETPRPISDDCCAG